MKKAWNIISTVLVWLIVIVAVLMMVFTIVSVNTFNRNDRNIFGYKAFIVLTDSMEPVFSAGDLVLAKNVEDPSTLKEGDIITFQSQSEHNYGEIVTHKIRSKGYSLDGQPGFVTYGVHNDNNDDTVVTYSFILGKYQTHLPKVGTFFNFLKTTPGYIVCILIPFLLLIGYQGLNCVKVFRLYKKEQMEELQAEKDAIEAERKKSEEMMAELLALKAQLEGKGVETPEAPSGEQNSPAQPAAEEKTEEAAAEASAEETETDPADPGEETKKED